MSEKKLIERIAMTDINIDEYCRSVEALLKDINEKCATKEKKKTLKEEMTPFDLDYSDIDN
jgi:hypothetical protein